MNTIVVEDEGITALFLKESLLDLHHSVAGVFNNATDLFDFLKNNHKKIDLIFMDINIEGSIDGIQAAKEISLEYGDISIVFITSFKDSHTIQEAQIAKPLGYLVKPISEVDLETVLMVTQANRTQTTAKQDEIILGAYTYNTDTQKLSYKHQLIHLTKNEKACVGLLMKNLNTQVSAELLMKHIWNDDKDRISSLRELLFRLRKKLIGLEISNTPNIGYTLKTV